MKIATLNSAFRTLCIAAGLALISADMTAVAETHTANNRNGVPGLKVTINDARIRRSGNKIVFYPVFQATGTKKIGQLYIDNNRYAWIDDEDPLTTYMPDVQVQVPADGEPMARYVEITDVPLSAGTFKTIKIVGRAPESAKSTSNNYYGDFDYKFANIPIPQFHSVEADRAAGKPGGMFTDNEISLAITGVEKEGKDIIVTFTLTNTGRTDKTISSADGYATTTDGDRISTSVRIPEALAAGETLKGNLLISGGADTQISSIRHKFNLFEKNLRFTPELILR